MTDARRQPGPWEEAEALRPAAPSAAGTKAAAPASASRTKEIVWALISSGLIAGWLWLAAGWVWALAGVFGILIHELGHLYAINRLGCGPGKIHFIPFLGGMATAKRASPTEWIDVLIALAGPAVGILASLPFFGLFALTGDGVWLQGAFFIALINLVNLAPAPPLDGSKALGPVLARIHPMVERVALLLVGGAAVAWALNRGSFIFAVFVAIGVFAALRSGRLRPFALKLSGREQAISVALWVVVTGACLGALFAAVRLAGSQADLIGVLTSI